MLDLFIYHHKAGLIRRNHCQKALRLSNKYWGPAIAAFFCICHKSEKTLRQLGQGVRNSFSYANACLLINSRIVKKILFCQSTSWTAFKT